MELEIIEIVVLYLDEELCINLICFVGMGIVIVIDDFGCGYLSLLYFKWLLIIWVKIDVLFVCNVDCFFDS